jgi:hypothetical protein
MITKPFRKLKKFTVLVGTPHNEIKNYCFDEFISNTTNFTYKYYNIVIADNSTRKKNSKQISKLGVNTIYIKPKQKDNQQFIAESHEALRLAALRENVDYLLHLESDIFPPKDIIERLLIHQLPVVSATYFIDEGLNSHLMVQEIEDKGDIIRESRNIVGGHDILLINGGLQKVYACGLGCTLIHKSVLEKIKFRWEKGAPVHPDTFFAADLNAMGIPQYIDTSILCEHRNSSWNLVPNVVR